MLSLQKAPCRAEDFLWDTACSLLFLRLQHSLSCKSSVSKNILHECEGRGNTEGP